MKLSTLAILLGLAAALTGAWGVWRPAAFAAFARRFPRNTPLGYPLVLGATVWFLYYVSQETVSDFAALKPLLYLLFGGVGLGTCLFVRDFLPVRGLAVLYLLLAKLMVDTARWEETSWRLVIAVWAYGLVIAGMWFTISPWRFRDLLQWATATQARIRLLNSLRLAFGLFVMVLGLTVYRAAERQDEAGWLRPPGQPDRRVHGPGLMAVALQQFGQPDRSAPLPQAFVGPFHEGENLQRLLQ